METIGLQDSPAMAAMRDQYIEVMARHDQIRKLDGYDHYREAINEYISKLIQDKIHHYQNPRNCSDPRKMVLL